MPVNLAYDWHRIDIEKYLLVELEARRGGQVET